MWLTGRHAGSIYFKLLQVCVYPLFLDPSLLFSGAVSFPLKADLRVKRISVNPLLVHTIYISIVLKTPSPHVSIPITDPLTIGPEWLTRSHCPWNNARDSPPIHKCLLRRVYGGSLVRLKYIRRENKRTLISWTSFHNDHSLFSLPTPLVPRPFKSEMKRPAGYLTKRWPFIVSHI